MNDNELDDLVRRLHRLTVAPKFPEYEHPTDRMRREQIVECRDAITALRAEVAALRQTLVAAETWIHAVPHGDNCYVCNHYEGDPGNQCNCGRESALAMIAASLDAARAAMREGT